MFDYPDVVRLVKANGHAVESIDAMAQPGLICISDESIPVEDTDIIERTLL